MRTSSMILLITLLVASATLLTTSMITDDTTLFIIGTTTLIFSALSFLYMEGAFRRVNGSSVIEEVSVPVEFIEDKQVSWMNAEDIRILNELYEGYDRD